MPKGIDQLFTERMVRIYRDAASEIGYRANYFLKRVKRDKGVDAAKYYLRADADVTDGFRRLADNDRLDLSVEAVVTDEPEWRSLFTPSELEIARLRLEKYGYFSRTAVPPRRDVDLMPDELDPNLRFPEGLKRQVTVNAVERDPDARRACIARYGTDCYVCGFNFRDFYGELGDGYVQVHHLIQLATAVGRVHTDPIRDLRPVCPNCHAMLHRKSPPLPVGELKRMIKGNRSRRLSGKAARSRTIAVRLVRGS